MVLATRMRMKMTTSPPTDSSTAKRSSRRSTVPASRSPSASRRRSWAYPTRAVCAPQPLFIHLWRRPKSAKRRARARARLSAAARGRARAGRGTLPARRVAARGHLRRGYTRCLQLVRPISLAIARAGLMQRQLVPLAGRRVARTAVCRRGGVGGGRRGGGACVLCPQGEGLRRTGCVARTGQAQDRGSGANGEAGEDGVEAESAGRRDAREEAGGERRAEDGVGCRRLICECA
jgi:hypothetical protein